MNDESPKEGSRSGLTRSLGKLIGYRGPRLVLDAMLEEFPRVRIEAVSYEDQQRLRAWLSRPAVRRRLHEVIDDVLDELRLAA